jgi:hypothetical protein
VSALSARLSTYGRVHVIPFPIHDGGWHPRILEEHVLLLEFHVGMHGMAFSAAPIHALGSRPETISALHKWCRDSNSIDIRLLSPQP